MSATDFDLIIIGAGVSGLSLAQPAARAGWKTLVLEQALQPGGCLHSHRFSGPLAGFWLELGAHSAFNSYSRLLAALESAGGLSQLQPRAKRRFRLYADGAIHSIFSQLSLMELLGAPLRLARLRLARHRKAGRSVAEFYRPIVGRRNYTAVFAPAFDAVLCQPAGEFPAEALFRPRTRRKDLPRGFILPGGLQTIAEILAHQPGLDLKLGQTVRSLHRSGPVFAVQTERQEYRARRLALATPASVAATLLAGVFPALAATLAEISVVTVESVGVALPAAQIALPPLAGLIGRNQAFYSVVSRDTAPDPRYRGFTFHFRPGALNQDAQLNSVAAVLNLPRAALTADNVIAKTNSLPALRPGHDVRIAQLDRGLAGSGLALTGNYFYGVALEDCVLRSLGEWSRLRRES